MALAAGHHLPGLGLHKDGDTGSGGAGGFGLLRDIDHVGRRPASSKWVRGGHSPSMAAGGGGQVVLLEQALADQEAADAGFAEEFDVLMGADAAFGDDEAVGGDAGGEVDRGLDVGLHGFEVTVVDADERGLQAEGTVEFALVMDFGQHVHVERAGEFLQFAGETVGEGGHDEQDAVRAHEAAFEHLPGVEDEVLAPGSGA